MKVNVHKPKQAGELPPDLEDKLLQADDELETHAQWMKQRDEYINIEIVQMLKLLYTAVLHGTILAACIKYLVS